VAVFYIFETGKGKLQQASFSGWDRALCRIEPCFGGSVGRGCVMRAESRVVNAGNETVGYVVDSSFAVLADVRKHINLIGNLKIDEYGVITPVKGALPVRYLREVNRDIYEELVSGNSLCREIQAELEKWKTERSDYVLYLSGARQIGKTTEIKKFAYSHYENILYLDLAVDQLREGLEQCIQGTLNVVFAFSDFCAQSNLADFVDSPDTVIILDEIQESVVLYNRIRQMQGGLKCHIIVSGSYLGKTLNSRYFKPAGNVWEVEMLPLSFMEFCDAFGCREKLQKIDLFGQGPAGHYRELYQLYSVYVQIGGYPAVVAEYKKSGEIDGCMEILGRLLQTFTEESAAYFTEDKCRIIFENVYKEAFRTIAKEKKGTSSKDIETVTNFVRDATKENVSRNEVNRAVTWLKYSRIIGACDLYNQGSTTDILSERRFYFMDCGIANCISRMTSMDNRTVAGVLTENFAYTELYRLYKTSRVKGDKPCCSVYGRYELDFMIVDRDDRKYGLEIKTSDENDPVSLIVYLDNGMVDKGYLAGRTKGGIRKKYDSIPIYAVGCRFPYRA